VSADAQLVRFYARGLLIKTHPRQAPGGQSIDPSDYPVERSVYAMRNVDALRRQAEAAGEVIGAVGVTGDTEDRDEELAAYGIHAVGLKTDEDCKDMGRKFRMRLTSGADGR
jgi:hypothetical protein